MPHLVRTPIEYELTVKIRVLAHKLEIHDTMPFFSEFTCVPNAPRKADQNTPPSCKDCDTMLAKAKHEVDEMFEIVEAFDAMRVRFDTLVAKDFIHDECAKAQRQLTTVIGVYNELNKLAPCDSVKPIALFPGSSSFDCMDDDTSIAEIIESLKGSD